MTWLKKRIKELGLARKGCAVQYSAVSDVQAAIEVLNSLVVFDFILRIWSVGAIPT